MSPENNSLTAVSAIDGRYYKKTKELSPYCSEMALIKTRTEVEAKYLIALSETGVIRLLTDKERDFLSNYGPNMSLYQVQKVKQIEDTTRHDVKAMERNLRESIQDNSLNKLTEAIHFGLTSEDINNLSYRLMLDRARKDVFVPVLDELTDSLIEKAELYKSIPMLARTHGQAAIPTTLGKEIANIAVRLNKQTRKMEKVELTGKLNGAVGNFNAHSFAAPKVDWLNFSEKFITSLGLKPNLYTTQINPYEDMIEVYQSFQRINGVLTDANQDFWRYISDNWFIQEMKKGEVGSSTMPQKINPIDFENSEGNLILANGIFNQATSKLAVSRLQRDLSDSTFIRGLNEALGHQLIAYKSSIRGLKRIFANETEIRQKLNQNYNILGEGVQTYLRRVNLQEPNSIEDPYSLVAELSKGKQINEDQWKDWVNNLPVNPEVKNKLQNLNPENYIGYAQDLTQKAIAEIKASRKSNS